MGFPAGEVAAGVAGMLRRRGLDGRADEADGAWRFTLPGVEIRVGPLPDARASGALFQPRSLLTVDGDGALAEAIRSAIRLEFLRVGG